MSDPRRYSISILEDYSEKPLQEIALAVTKKIEKEISADDFTLEDIEDLELGTNFLTTEEPYTWRNVVEDLAPAFTAFPDTCFCLSVSDGEDGGQYRTLFFNGKAVTQYPEIRYPDFHINDFEYQSSDKTPLEKIAVTVEKVEKAASEHLSKVIDALSKNAFGYASDAEKEVNEPDPVQLDFIKKSLFCDIILENAQDA
ncbi:MAG: hypothetical protein IM526_02530 [Microcystis sp. M38BS1]|uniref:hypothetical protein n=1 Tax=Microcystis sp. M38BS1 TaxID=2771188 RepID=UPI0031FD6A5D|nr:hypothetical protein [Microcystis sp. M38BS1]MCA6582535.1 hypothetical protein [Pseudanabaena sp. M34BS1SP1A06MG]